MTCIISCNLYVLSSLTTEYAQLIFDYILLGVLPSVRYIHNNELLEEIVCIIKPSGVLTFKEPITTTIDSGILSSKCVLL